MDKLLQKLIIGTFYALIFATPLLVTKVNSELFEFNKMLFVYASTIIIVSAWLIRLVRKGSLIINRTPLDIPILLFVIIQLIATVFSIDPHISIWGYYGRFNGGLLSTLCYSLLYFVAVSNLNKKHVIGLLHTAIISGIFVALYGIAQHFGIDAHLWVQDVKNRVFSTLGQPNWLAAFMAILIPISVAIGISSKFKVQSSKQYKNTKTQKSKWEEELNLVKLYKFWVLDFGVWILVAVFYTTLLFTKSRSGFIGFWIANLLFWIGMFSFSQKQKAYKKTCTISSTFLKPLLIVNSLFIILTILLGSPFQKLNILTEKIQSNDMITKQQTQPKTDNNQSKRLNITDSGDIRKIVWKGSIEAVKSNPIIGYGPETFAWAYYMHKPVEHNTTSEWDFLYNKAHNEYLNYATTSGLLGLGSYLLIIFIFIGWLFIPKIDYSSLSTKKLHSLNFAHLNLFKVSPILRSASEENIGFHILMIGLFAGWLSILVTNFFGFSVVITNLYFFLIPAFVFIISNKLQAMTYNLRIVNSIKRLIMIAIIVASAYLLTGIVNYWIADYHYSLGKISSRLGKHQESLKHYKIASSLRSFEPNYHNGLSEELAYVSILAYELGEDELADQYIAKAIKESDIALSISSYNVSFWKNRTKMFYTLSQVNEKYYNDALSSIQVASSLAPSDAKILYNLGLLQNSVGDNKSAIDTMTQTLEIKPNYRDAAWALALFYEEENNIEKRDKWLNYILEQINPDDSEVINKLNK